MIAAVDLGGTRTKFGLMAEGALVAASQCPADAQGSISDHLAVVLSHLEDLCAAQGTTLNACDGLGLLSTGLVDNREMRVLSTNGKYDDAVDFDFRTWSAEAAGLELRMENDARGALIGEWRYGAGRGVDNLVMISIGTGIGTAAVVNGSPLSGPHFAGGSLGGHIVVHSGGRRCTCGGVGCLEAEASGWALPGLVREHEHYAASSLNGVDPIGFRELRAHADAGDACAQAVQARCLQLWGEALVSYVHLFDPDRMIVGGGILNDPIPVLASFRKTVAELCWGELGQIDIVHAEHPDNAGLVGASALFAE